MNFDSRLFNIKALREIVEVSDDVQNNLSEFNDLLSRYEQIDDDFPKEERSDAREELRAEAWTLLGDVIVDLERLRSFRDRLVISDEAVVSPS